MTIHLYANLLHFIIIPSHTILHMLTSKHKHNTLKSYETTAMKTACSDLQNETGRPHIISIQPANNYSCQVLSVLITLPVVSE